MFSQELERITAKIKIIRENYSDHQSWTDDDRTQYERMKARKLELKEILGVEF